jgi:hypothetical protein
MKTLVLAVLLATGLAAPAGAGRNAGGAMVVHTNDALSYTMNICTQWNGVHDPGSCASAATRTDRNESTPALIWLVAAFYESLDPEVTVVYFGLEHNLPDGSYFVNYGLCGPGNSIEIPDAGWPAQGRGNSIAFGTPVSGDVFFPFYFFNVYGFQGAYLGSGVNPTGGYAGFVDNENPPTFDRCERFGRVRWYEEGTNACPEPPTGACCLETGICLILTAEECEAEGADYQGHYAPCESSPCPILGGACCFPDGHCEILTAADCGIFQGFWLGPSVPCGHNPCPQPLQACCFAEGACTMTTADDCRAQGGTPQGYGTICEELACRALLLGACCLSNGSCAVLSEEECAAQGGAYLPDVPCAPEDPCFAPAVEETSWGHIKSRFR